MNEQDYESNYGAMNTNGSINIPNGSNNKSSNIGSPSSPSSLSSSSSTSSTSSISSSNQQATAAAVQAAMQALLQNNSSSQSLLTSKELAKLNLDVKNFKLQDTLGGMSGQPQLNLNNLLAAAAAASTNSTSPNSLTLQQQLLMQSQNLDQQAMLNLLNNSNLGKNNQAKQTPKTNRQTNGKLQTPQSNRRFEQSFDEDESVAAAAAAMMAAATSGANTALNINLINKHNQRNIRRDLVKGNSMSPSPPGTSCSDETETQSGSPLSSSMLMKNEPHYNGIGSISTASSCSVDDNHSSSSSRRRPKGSSRPKNKSIDNDDLIENDCDENDDIDSRSSPRSLSIHQNDTDLTQTNQDYDNSILNENDDHNHNSNYDDIDHDDDDDYDDNLEDGDDYGQKTPAKKNKLENDSNIRNRNNSTSSPTRSSSSTPQSRSISPSNSYHDSPAAFPNLAAVAAANGIDSTTAMLAAQSLLQQQTPGLSFPSLSAAGLGMNRTPGNTSNASLGTPNSGKYNFFLFTLHMFY